MTVKMCDIILTDEWGYADGLTMEQARAVVRIYDACKGSEDVDGLLIEVQP